MLALHCTTGGTRPPLFPLRWIRSIHHPSTHMHALMHVPVCTRIHTCKLAQLYTDNFLWRGKLKTLSLFPFASSDRITLILRRSKLLRYVETSIFELMDRLQSEEKSGFSIISGMNELYAMQRAGRPNDAIARKLIMFVRTAELKRKMWFLRLVHTRQPDVVTEEDVEGFANYSCDFWNGSLLLGCHDNTNSSPSALAHFLVRDDVSTSLARE